MKKDDFPMLCRDCTYFRCIKDIGEYICDYNSQENKLRGCAISEDCTCYQPRGKSRKPLNVVDIVK